jgi:pathogenesis-related protein 1
MIGEAEVNLRFCAMGILAALAATAATAAAADGSMPEQMLAAHNAARAAVKTKPLVWSDKLAVAAQDWANLLLTRQLLVHQKKSKFGENLYELVGARAKPEDVVKVWTSEAVDYDYKTNRCRTACGHYTQVIWRDTRELGCAVARRGAREVWVCEYAPAGNYVGERPY